VNAIKFHYFGLVDPEFYGIGAGYLPGSGITFDPPATQTSETPKYVAVSATSLAGVYLNREDKAALGALMRRLKEPIAAIGHSIFIFRLE